MELKPHQRVALSKLGPGKILWGGTGTGKTFVAVAYYMTHQVPKDVYVITTAKKRDSLDWESEFAQYAIGREDSIAGKLTVDSWNNIGKYVKVEGAYFILDEQRVPGSGAWVKAFYKIARKNDWNLLTATPGDNWMDYIPVFVANGYYRNKTDFLDQHVEFAPFSKYPKVVGYKNVNKLVRLRNELLIHMPYERETVRHQRNIFCEFDKDKMEVVAKKWWHIFEHRPLRNSAELFIVMRQLVNTDKSRLEALRKLMKKHPKIIVFYNTNAELELLRELVEEVRIAEWNGHKHEEIPTDVGRWLYLVQYAAGSEGWNCVETDTTVFFSLTYSYKMWHQAHGRIDRLNTPYVDLWYYIFRSRSMIDLLIWRSLMDKKNFNEKDVNLNELGASHVQLQEEG